MYLKVSFYANPPTFRWFLRDLTSKVNITLSHINEVTGYSLLDKLSRILPKRDTRN